MGICDTYKQQVTPFAAYHMEKIYSMSWLRCRLPAAEGQSHANAFLLALDALETDWMVLSCCGGGQAFLHSYRKPKEKGVPLHMFLSPILASRGSVSCLPLFIIIASILVLVAFSVAYGTQCRSQGEKFSSFPVVGDSHSVPPLLQTLSEVSPSPDGHHLAVGSAEGDLFVVSFPALELVHSHKPCVQCINKICWSTGGAAVRGMSFAAGEAMAVASSDGKIYTYSLNNHATEGLQETALSLGVLVSMLPPLARVVLARLTSPVPSLSHTHKHTSFLPLFSHTFSPLFIFSLFTVSSL